MSKQVTISPDEAADRLAIRELVEAYAHCADRRDAKGQMSLFTPDTYFVVYMNAKDPTPSQDDLRHRCQTAGNAPCRDQGLPGVRRQGEKSSEDRITRGQFALRATSPASDPGA